MKGDRQIGTVQRNALRLLAERGGKAHVSELGLVGDSATFNMYRAFRSLLKRGLVTQETERGAYQLTPSGKKAAERADR